MKALRLLLITITLVFLAASLCGDILYLKDGRKLEGKVFQKGNRVEIQTKFGKVTFPMSKVERIEYKKTNEQEYKERRENIAKGDGDGHYQLALWCKERNMRKEMTKELKEVIKLNPDHEGARKLLGYHRLGDRWLTAPQMEKEGYQQLDGKWVTKREFLLKKPARNYDFVSSAF